MVVSPGLVKVDSTREKQHRLQHRLLKMLLICLHYFAAQINRSSVLHDLRNLDDRYVNREYILYKVITAKYSGSLYAVTFTLTLIPCKSTSGNSISKYTLNIPQGQVVRSCVKITQGLCEIWFQIWKLKKKIQRNYFVFNLMIGFSIKNKENYRRKCF